MFRLVLLLCAARALSAHAIASDTPAVPSAKEMAQIRQEVETLRGKKFLRDVPARTISEKELRAIIDREIAKQYPGRKLADLQDLMAWMDVIPTNTDLASICAKMMLDQVAGLYDSDTKTMCLPSFQSTNHGSGKSRKNPSEKKLEKLSSPDVGIVFAHEYTHALEDQYWPIDDAEDEDSQDSTDRGEAQGFLMEGSATRLMVEALPAESEREQPGSYLIMWNLLHSGLGETVLDLAFSQVWKSSEVKTPGVPETLSRGEAMPYSFGYTFCRRIQRNWGLDGLDYIYDHPPVSTAQVMHPEKCWEWRDFPVQIDLPATLPGGWKQLMDDTVGEAGTAALLGCQFKNLNRGQRLANGWDGDRVALYEAADGRRLLVWVSAWDSALAAERFARACAQERRVVHQATLRKKPGQVLAWTRPDGRAGAIRWDGKHVLLFETDQPAALDQTADWAPTVRFTEPPEDAARAAANHTLLRFNPVVSWRKDGDYTVTRSLAGLLWRHDQNSVGAGDRALLGLVGSWHRTTSLNEWRLGWGLAARHESEARRGTTKTTVLPWGVLCSHFSTPLPQAPTNSLSRTSLLWGLAACSKTDAKQKHVLTLLPGGLLFRSTTAPAQSGVHVLGTGFSRQETAKDDGITSRFRFLGLPIWTRHSAPSPQRQARN